MSGGRQVCQLCIAGGRLDWGLYLYCFKDKLFIILYFKFLVNVSNFKVLNRYFLGDYFLNCLLRLIILSHLLACKLY